MSMDDLLNSAPCGVLTYNDDGSIRWANATLLAWLGYALTEVQGQRIDMLLSMGGQIFYQTHIFPLLLLQGKVEEIYLTLRGRGGKQLPILLNATRGERDGVTVIDAVVVPMRQRSHYEDALIRAKAVAEAAIHDRNQATHAFVELQKPESLDVLVSGVAHDFNNLLAAILGNADLALLDLEEGHPAHPSVMQISIASRRAAELTRRLLVYSGQARLVVEPLDLNTIVQELVLLLRASIPKSVKMDYVLAPDLPAVEADATQLRQVVMNLMINGVEAMGGAKGQVEVRTALRDVDEAFLEACIFGSDLPPGLYVAVTVSDTGKGMDAALLKKIFEPFFTTKSSGRGLGMAAVLGVVRAHRGAIHITSVVGKGTTIAILLPPATLAQAQAMTQASLTAVSGAAHR